ncbi:MAG: T9SS type A sorting domain-containing protein [Crocinitomicaceae bacterium]
MQSFKVILAILLFCPMFSYSQVQIGSDIDGESIFDQSGWAVASSTDGNRVAIGAPSNSGVNGTNSGHARIYENQNGSWIQLGNDIDGDSPNDFLGTSVALSADANIVAVGASYKTVGGVGYAGQVKVFQYQTGNWSQIGSDILGGPLSEQAGYRVALSGQGDIIAVASPSYHLPNQTAARGRIRVYQNQMGAWVQLGGDIIGDGATDLFGRGLDISFDGSILAVGGPSAVTGTSPEGYVKIYKFESGSWQQIGNTLEGDPGSSGFGYAVSLSSDGNTVVSGSSTENDINGVNTGVVKVYENQSGVWIQKGNSIFGNQANTSFSQSLSIAANGNVISIAAKGQSNGGTNGSGVVRFYGYQAGVWSQLGADIFGEAALDQSGYSEAISGDGTKVVIGSKDNNGNGAASGHVRIYDMSAFVTVTNNINESTVDKWSFYPNPASDLVHIEFTADELPRRIAIYDQLGRFVRYELNTTFSVKDLKPGFYILQIENNMRISKKKLIVR